MKIKIVVVVVLSAESINGINNLIMTNSNAKMVNTLKSINYFLASLNTRSM